MLSEQTAQTLSEELRKRAPQPLEPKPFNVPQPFETELPNGLKVVFIERKKLPLLTLRLAFRSGQINDPKNFKGLTSAMTAMIQEGTTTRTSRQLAEEVEMLGASLNANSSSDNTIVSASTLSMYGSEILKIMADIVLNPVFPEKELALYKQNTIEGLKVQRADASFLAHERMAKIIYGGHPYSVVAPSPADVEKITREQLIDFHKQKFVPNNAILIVVGNVERENLLNELNSLFGNWQKGEVGRQEFSVPPERTEKTVTIVDRPGSAQSNIILSNLAINRNHPDYFPALVMNQILGAGASSRLFMNLREEKGYTYGAYSSFDARRQSGAFEAAAEVRTMVTGDSLKEFFYEIERIRNQEVSDRELQDAKNYLTGVFPLRAETQEGLTNLIVAQQLYDLPADFLQTYREKISDVNSKEVQRVANAYLIPDKIAIVVVGDAGEILDQVKAFSEKIDVFDIEGNPVDVSKYGREAAEPTVDVTGKWDLMLEIQGQQLPVSLDLVQGIDKVTGRLDSMLGSGEIEVGKVSGNKLSAVTETEIQGQPVSLSLAGTVEDNTMKGVITTGIPGFPPVNFEGKRNS
jgi:zinc protease